LDEILVGPVPVGVNKFVLQADAPDPAKLPPEDLLGVTVVLVTCSYKEREFVRVGYYVNNEYNDPNAPPPVEGEERQLPNPIPVEYIQRQILADKPRVTKFPIPWGAEDEKQMQQAAQGGAGNNQAMMGEQGLMDMQEESNASFPLAGHQNDSVQAMAE
jgi:histone chaperone ASF1